MAPRSLVVLIIQALAASAAAAKRLRAPNDKPNVIMLFVDDLGYGDVGFNGHPTTQTPNIDSMAWNGKILTTWYSACPVCTCSRASLMTGRQWPRFGILPVISPTTDTGLALNETTIADELKKAGYATAIAGKWHLGQREAYLPAARGFDSYLGIPYSDDMGEARASPCDHPGGARGTSGFSKRPGGSRSAVLDAMGPYVEAGLTPPPSAAEKNDPAGDFLPLVSQRKDPATGKVATEVLEQPVDLTRLAPKYEKFATDFIRDHADEPFFLYLPFSHVHTTADNQPEKQYCDCEHKNATRRGAFGDALAETDTIIGRVRAALEAHGLEGNTLILFTGDNGPWMVQGSSGGSTGLLSGRFAGYWNVGKGSTWEGGIREAGFAYWPGTIKPFTRSSEIVSSMDVFPTVLKLAGLPLPTDRAYDGRDFTRVLLEDAGKSEHEVLFFYGGAAGRTLPSAARYGPFKAHWATGPGLSGCEPSPAAPAGCPVVTYPGGPLVFNVEVDPSEAYPLTYNTTSPPDPALRAVVAKFVAAYEEEIRNVQRHVSPPAPLGPGEGPGRYGVCCNRTLGCDCDGPPSSSHDLESLRAAIN